MYTRSGLSAKIPSGDPHVHFSCPGNAVKGLGQSPTGSYIPYCSCPPFCGTAPSSSAPCSGWGMSVCFWLPDAAAPWPDWATAVLMGATLLASSKKTAVPIVSVSLRSLIMPASDSLYASVNQHWRGRAVRLRLWILDPEAGIYIRGSLLSRDLTPVFLSLFARRHLVLLFGSRIQKLR